MTLSVYTNRQRGLSLVELLVAMAIGLLVTLVVTEAYVNATSTQRSQNDKSRVQETMRFALDTLMYAVRKAGYRNPAISGGSVTDFCGGVSARLMARNDAATVDPTAADLTTSETGAKTILNKSDVLRVRYNGDGATVSPFTADGSITDCLGNGVPANQTVEDTFFIAADADNNNEPSLFCYTSNAATAGSVAIVPGVESLQLLFGDDSNADASISRFVTSEAVSAINNVRSVVISIVARSPNATAITSGTQVFTHFGAGYTGKDGTGTTVLDAGSTFTAPDDHRARQMAGTTVALMNICPM